jgi:predicted secreted protein
MKYNFITRTRHLEYEIVDVRKIMEKLIIPVISISKKLKNDKLRIVIIKKNSLTCLNSFVKPNLYEIIYNHLNDVG